MNLHKKSVLETDEPGLDFFPQISAMLTISNQLMVWQVMNPLWLSGWFKSLQCLCFTLRVGEGNKNRSVIQLFLLCLCPSLTTLLSNLPFTRHMWKSCVPVSFWSQYQQQGGEDGSSLHAATYHKNTQHYKAEITGQINLIDTRV